MRKMAHWLVGGLLIGVTFSTQATILVTPFLGYTGGGHVADGNGETYDINPEMSYALSIEAPLDSGKIGLFYSYQSTELKQLSNSADIHYLQFQSSIDYPISPRWQTYLGLGLGGSYTDVDWVDKKLGFSASAFAGLKYEFSDRITLNAQLRWLGTVVDNDTTGACTLPTSDDSRCVIQFDTSWMNQFQSNVGFQFRL
ncbi:porin family protein [Vibrio mytili]|uniref:outer membrane beta-barrel protein n=1 Tax=Vibrio mytili TaxID=50718 RepID=UPI002F409E3F